MRVEYADRDLAPEGCEDFSAFLQDLCNRQESQGYRLIAVLPGDHPEGHLLGAWLFFSEGQEESIMPLAMSAMLEQPLNERGMVPE
jgi:hypothetical protein